MNIFMNISYGFIFCISFLSLSILNLNIVSAKTYNIVSLENNGKEPEPSSPLIDNGQFISSRVSVSTANPYATNAAINILKKGGNAVDASIAAMLVLGVVEPQSSGLGGGGFALIYDNKTKSIKSFDGREMSPTATKNDIFMINNKEMSFEDAAHSGISVGVPGFLSLAKEMHTKYGKLPWSMLFRDAIDLSTKGFIMPPRLYFSLHTFKDEIKRVNTEDTFLDWYMYFDRNGEPKKQNSKIINTDIAVTLKRLSLSDGVNYFYKNTIADHIVERVQNAKTIKGFITKKDLEDYKSTENDPICIVYKDRYKICTANLPSTGITVLQAMKLVERFDLKSIYFQNLAGFMNIMLEALKIAFADRNAFYTDPKFMTLTSEKFFDFNYINSRSRLIKIDDSRSIYQSGYQNYLNKDYGRSDNTTHVSVIDDRGNAVSFTSSIENGFGSMIMVDGFVLNNTMTDFNFNYIKDGKSVANMPEPSKRPRSSMSPIVVIDLKDNSLKAVLGSPGGARIISYIFKNLILLLDIELDPQTISKLPNFATMNSGNIEIEKRTRPSMISIAEALKKSGQEISFDNELTSGVNIIAVYNTCVEKNKINVVKSPNLEQNTCTPIYKAYSDYRRDGTASGY